MQRTPISVKNPVYMNAEETRIHLDVVFEELKHMGELPFCAVPDDAHGHGVDLFNRAKAGEFGPVAPYVEPAPAKA